MIVSSELPPGRMRAGLLDCVAMVFLVLGFALPTPGRTGAIPDSLLPDGPSAMFQDSSGVSGPGAIGEGDTRSPLRVIPNRAFRPGERLVFSVEYGPVKAGRASMEVTGMETVNGRPCYHLRSVAKTNELFSNFFKVEDRVDSFMDVDGLFSWRFEKHLREGDYRSDMEVIYDQIGHKAIMDKDTMDVPAFVQDILSGFYYGRVQDLAVGKSVFIENHSGRKIYSLEVKVIGKERIKVPAGVFKCVIIEPMLQAVGIFKHSGRLRVWLTDDEQKMPVLMTSKMVIGSVAAKLVEYDPGGQD